MSAARTSARRSTPSASTRRLPASEVRLLVVGERRALAVALDAHHVGPETGELVGGECGRDAAAELHDADAFERSPGVFLTHGLSLPAALPPTHSA